MSMFPVVVPGVWLAGFLASRWWTLRQRNGEHARLLKQSHELGIDAGRELYWLEALAKPPELTRLVASWDASACRSARQQMSEWASGIEFAKGRHYGWWEAAQMHVVDEAYDLLK